MEFVVATCQFAVSGNPRTNLRHVLRQMRAASKRGAHVCHFAETALSGYVGVDLPSLDDYPWAELEEATRAIMQLARELSIWVVIGSMHRAGERRKPTNCALVIDQRGRLVDRYDKRFCTGNAEETKGDLRFFRPGNRTVLFKIRGRVCTVLVCHDYRYPELQRETRRRGAQVVFHCFHQAGFSAGKMRGKGRVHRSVTPATMQCYAAVNHQWISAANSSRQHSAWGSFTVSPDGMLAGRLPAGRAGVLLTTLRGEDAFEDAARSWRDHAMAGRLHSGKLA